MNVNIIRPSIIIAVLCANILCKHEHKRALQRSHEKSRTDKLLETFYLEKTRDEYVELVDLLVLIYNNYLYKCVPIVIYDEDRYEYFVVMENLFKRINTTFIHGFAAQYIVDKTIKFQANPMDTHCNNYILFVYDVLNSKYIMGKQNIDRVVIVTYSSQWKVNDFLLSKASRNLINLLIIAPSDWSGFEETELYYVLYTHELYIDGLGASSPKILTSWRNGSLSQPKVKLFSQKMHTGFSGHRFITSVAHQPPYVINRGLDDNDDVIWDGIEIKLLRMLAQLYNFTLDIRPAKDGLFKSPADKVIDNVNDGIVNVGLSGIYLTKERLEKLDVGYPHSYDCAAFISLTSTALPRYRAIMGPFQWTVWLALTIIYLFAIFPLTFADKHTLKNLLTNPSEMENMFWYVFGTFTNSFTFGKAAWVKSPKVTPRLLMGFYWIFTTIITACYTGSIIAFITIPIFPTTVDTVQQLLYGRYQIGTLDTGGWEFWFKNSSDKDSQRLLKNLELLPNVESGLRNITRAFFWPYAFLGSRAQLDYMVQTNFTLNKKKSLFHISSDCFAPFGVSAVFEKYSIYKDVIDRGMSYMSQSGFINKFEHDIRWDFMRTSTGKLLQATGTNTLKLLSVDDRSLTLDDTQGTFLLLIAGFLAGIVSLAFESIGGFFKCYNRKKRFSTASTISSNPRWYDGPTLREKLYSLQYYCSEISILPNNMRENNNNNNVELGTQQCTASNKFEDTNDNMTDSEKNSCLRKKYINIETIFGEEN